MNIIQSFWSCNKENLLKENFGWLAPEYNLMSWALSCLQLNKFYKDITLYADTASARMLIDILKLPYSNVVCELDMLNHFHENLWALPKIYSYSKQDKPFLHVDGDVYIWKEFDDELMSGDLIAQNKEAATDYYEAKFSQLETSLIYFPSVIQAERKNNNLMYAYNAGIFGGHDIDFFRRYANEAFEFVINNNSALQEINVTDFNIFFEQYLFYCMAKDESKQIHLLFNEVIGDNQYTGFGDFIEVPHNKQYLHLLGVYKRNNQVCSQLADRLRLDYPEYYYKIISLFKSNQLCLHRDYYHYCSNFDEGILCERYKLLKNETLRNRELQYFAVQDLQAFPFDKNLGPVEGNVNFIRLKYFLHFSNDVLYARDINTAESFQYLFQFPDEISEKKLRSGYHVLLKNLPSEFLYEYLRESEIDEDYLSDDEYFLAIVPECDIKGYSLVLIDKLDCIILKTISCQITVGNLMETLKQYFDEEDLNDSLSEYCKLILGRIKMLLSNKLISCKK